MVTSHAKGLLHVYTAKRRELFKKKSKWILGFYLFSVENMVLPGNHLEQPNSIFDTNPGNSQRNYLKNNQLPKAKTFDF